MEPARLRNPHPSASLCFLLLTLLARVAAAPYATYSSLCHFPVPVLDMPASHHSNGTRSNHPSIPTATGHFSGGGDLHFAPDQSHFTRSFVFRPQSHVLTTDPTVIHIYAKLILEEGSGHDGHRRHFVLFELEGYYSTANASSAQLCMVGSGSYERDDGVGTEVPLSDVALRIHVPRPVSLSQPFITGSLEGADFGPVILVAYADIDDGYAYAHTANFSCPAPPEAVRDGRHVFNAAFSCSRLRRLLRGSYSLDYRHTASKSNSPVRLSHRRMDIYQMSCSADGSFRAYMEFRADRSDFFPSNHSVESGDDVSLLSLVRDNEALVSEGLWDSSRSQLCLTACRVVRTGPSRADAAVGECGIGISFWFPAVWSLGDWRTAAGIIWNASRTSVDGDTDVKAPSGVISVSRTVRDTYSGDLTDIKYNYTRVVEATKRYHSRSKTSSFLSTGRKSAGSRFPGSSRRDFAFHFSQKKRGVSGSAWPIAIGSTFLDGDTLLSDDVFSQRVAAEMNSSQSLPNVSYYLQYQVRGANSYPIKSPEMSQKRSLMAEGVYDTKTGYMCMVACRDIDGSSDCEVVVTIQFAPMDGKVRDRTTSMISSLRKKSDPLFFEALDFVASGIYKVQRDDLEWWMVVDGATLVVSTALSVVFIIPQLRHGKKHPEAHPATSITMLVILALGYLIPLLLNFETTVMPMRDFFPQLALSNTGGIVLRGITVLAFVLQLRLLQVALSARRPTGARNDDGGASSSAAAAVAATERSTLRVCLPLYIAGAALMLFVYKTNKSDGGGPPYLVATGPTSAEVLASYGGLILDAFLLPQVVSNAFPGVKTNALSPWFYVGGTVNRAAPHLCNVFWPAPFGLFGVAWEVAIVCGAALLAVLLFLQQRLGGAFLCCLMSWSGKYRIVSTLGS